MAWAAAVPVDIHMRSMTSAICSVVLAAVSAIFLTAFLAVDLVVVDAAVVHQDQQLVQVFVMI